jgi:hypothetical protein
MLRHSVVSRGRLLRTVLACAVLHAAVAAVVQAQAAPGDAAVSGNTEPAAAAAADSGSQAAAQPAPTAPTGPIIELPPEMTNEAGATTPAPAQPTGPAASTDDWPRISLGVMSDADTMNRGLMPQRMAQSNTVIGGYGQFTLNATLPGNQDEFNARASVRRLVLFVAHPITDDIRVYTEFEWENAVACNGCNGSVEIEQAFLQWRLAGDAFMLRSGLLLVPMGIVNQWHEPPVFHGVERPGVDTFIIPSTWRELGAGFAGTIAEMYRYELYLTTTLDPLRLSENGLGGARTLGSLALSSAFAVTGRAEVEPVLGVIAGVSFFVSDLGANGKYYRQNGTERDLRLPLLGYALDARMRRWGFEMRAVWAQFFFPNAGDLVNAFRDDGSPLFIREATKGTVAERIQGGYFEIAYNVFHEYQLSHELLGFVRLETYDTQAAVPDTYKRNPALGIDELTAGLSYRPVTQLVFKTDFQLRDRRLGWDEFQYNLGFGYMF